MDRLRNLLRPLAYLGRNPTTLTGAVVTTSAGISLVLLMLVEAFGEHHPRPYAGIVLFLILPAIFVAGLLLMPLGLILRRRALKARGELPTAYPVVDFASPLIQHSLLLVVAATFLNVGLLGMSGYKGVEHMDSVDFCGATCHTVMQPEYTAYLGSPHSRVVCVECHIGPGASWFVKSKLDGIRQVVATALDTYSRPIPSPVHELRPARETCEQCHWPRKFHGDQLQVRVRYAEDEANTKLTTVLVMRIGGHAGTTGSGIHGRHLDEKERIHYVPADDRRQAIGRVTYLNDEGRLEEYLAEGANPAAQAGAERAMDCVDCHNRPTHAFQLPHRAIDRAIEEGRISQALPYVKKKAVELLSAEYPDRDTAARRITEGLVEYYRKDHPPVFEKRRKEVDAAAGAAADAYLRNVFPAMKVVWGTHPNNIGHEDFPGCFRCHDDQHKTKDGKTISQDCAACHAILAMEESDPKVLANLGFSGAN